jgi:hypothetical protein
MISETLSPGTTRLVVDSPQNREPQQPIMFAYSDASEVLTLRSSVSCGDVETSVRQRGWEWTGDEGDDSLTSMMSHCEGEVSKLRPEKVKAERSRTSMSLVAMWKDACTHDRVETRHDADEEHQEPQCHGVSDQPAHLHDTLSAARPKPLASICSSAAGREIFSRTTINAAMRAMVSQAIHDFLAHHRVRRKKNERTRHATLDASVSKPCSRG